MAEANSRRRVRKDNGAAVYQVYINTNSREFPPQKFAPQKSAHPPILMAEADPPSSLAEKAEWARIINEKYSCEFDKNSCIFVSER